MNTINLQGLGQVNAKPASELQKGDVTLWNFGYTSVVDSLVSETAKMITFKMRYTDLGVERSGNRTFKKSRLVGISAR